MAAAAEATPVERSATQLSLAAAEYDKFVA
jgi:hypothetical protein